MQIELHNIRHTIFASHETPCFEAVVYLDGERAGTVRNSGTGGSCIIQPRSLQERLDAYAKTLPTRIVFTLVDNNDTNLEYQPDADTLIMDEFAKWDAERQLKRLLPKRIVFIRDGDVMQSKPMPPDQLRDALKPEHLDATKKSLRTDTVLNVLPFADALKLFLDPNAIIG